MEFEKAVFRVYEFSIESISHESPAQHQARRKCLQFSYFLCALGVMFTIIMTVSHLLFVGDAGCLPEALNNQYFSVYASELNQTEQKEYKELQYDQLLLVTMTDDTTGDLKHLRSLPPREISSHADKNGNNDYNHSVSSLEYVSKSNSNAYKFSYDIGLLVLPDQLRSQHFFDTINITLSTKDCFYQGNSFGLRSLGLSMLLQFVPMETIVMNMIRYSFHPNDSLIEDSSKAGGLNNSDVKIPKRSIGHLVAPSGNYFYWRYISIDRTDTISSIINWVGTKFDVLSSSILAFFLMSTITALLIRVLISSGIMIFFPIIYLMRLWGIMGDNDTVNLRILSVSYPWLGIPMEMVSDVYYKTITGITLC